MNRDNPKVKVKTENSQPDKPERDSKEGRTSDKVNNREESLHVDNKKGKT